MFSNNKFVVAIFMAFVAFGFTACANVAREVYTPEQSENYGFNVSGESVLKNPPENKARVYIMRESKFAGSAISPNHYYQYEPKLDATNKLIIEKQAYINNVIGKLSNGLKIYKDFDTGKPLLIVAGGGWYAKTYIVFTPQAGKIYCINGKMGIINGFFNKEQCETLYLKTKPKELY